MYFTLSGMVMLVRLLQAANAQIPMRFTPSGIMMFVSFLQSRNACPPMLVTPFEICTVQIVVLSLYHGLPLIDPFHDQSHIFPVPKMERTPASISSV